MKRIPVTSFRQLNLKHKIKRKKVWQEKYLPEHIKQMYDFKRKACVDQLEEAKK